VTAAGRGTARAIPLAFARERADVVVNYMSRPEQARVVADEMGRLG
jgi:NAD(P)-dependent dehydrogenase (short-subunit alcohol dehydrogenase family)